jgi:hypothetical protein
MGDSADVRPISTIAGLIDHEMTFIFLSALEAL